MIPQIALAGTDLYLPTVENFPALAHLIPISELTGATTITDTVGGCVISDGTVTKNADGTATLSATFATLDSGTVTGPGTKSIFFVYVGKPSATVNNVTFGANSANTDYGFRISSVAATRLRCCANGAATLDAGTNNTVGDGSTMWARGLHVQFGSTTRLNGVEFNGTTFNDFTDGTNADFTNGISTANMVQAITINQNARPWGIYVMYLDNPLSEAEQKAAVAWAHWAAAVENDKNKLITPFLRGRT